VVEDGPEIEQLPRGRHGLPRQAVTESQRRRILRALVETVAERGYAETRVADVIAAAGVSRKTFYELFADKEDCFLVAFDDWFGSLIADATDAYEVAAEAPWAERIEAALAAFLERIASDPAAARSFVVEVLAAGPKAVARRDAAIRQFAHLVDAGRAESSAELPGITSLALVGGMNELLYSEILHGAAAGLEQRLPDLVYWVTQPYLGEERATEERSKARRARSRRPAEAPALERSPA
jgi:AcrR family transcriptional regulator